MSCLDSARSVGKDAQLRMPDGVFYCGPVWRTGPDWNPTHFVLYRNQPHYVKWSVPLGQWALLGDTQ